MSAITVMVGGVERTITDITSYRSDLANTGRLLEKLYADFDPERPELLVSREEDIVKLFNRYHELRAIIDQWDGAEQSRENVLAGWALVEEIRKGSAS